MTELLKKTIKESKDMICKVNYASFFIVRHQNVVLTRVRVMIAVSFYQSGCE